MELENLKSIWNELESPSNPEQDREDIALLLQKKSQGPVARMKRNLRTELLFILFTYIPLIILYLVAFQGRMSGISLLLFLVGGFFGAYYYRKYRLLNKMQCNSCEVRSNLALQVKTLKKYVRFYLISSTLVIPIVAIITFVVFRSQMTYPKATDLYWHLHPAPWWKSSIFWLILLVPETIALHYFNVWYLNKLYGRHIKKLQELLREMDEE